MDEKTYTLEQAHKSIGVELNQLTWSLLGKENRSADEDEKMIHAAHASHFHWLQCGTKVNEQRGEWLISRVYSVLNIPERAVFHALKCKKLTDENPDGMCDFDLAFAEEALARAYACSGNEEKCMTHLNASKKLGEKIADDEDKKIFMSDLNSEPWFGIIST